MTDISSLENLIEQYKFLAKLESGDRLAQDPSTKQINGRYSAPSNHIQKCFQALSRTVINSHDSTPEAIAQINKIVSETKHILKKNVFPTMYDGILKFNDVHHKLTILNRLVNESLPKLIIYEETVTSCASNLIGKNDEEITNLKSSLETIINKLKVISKEVLNPKIESYNEIVTTCSKKQVSEIEKLEKTLAALMNPVVLDPSDTTFDLSTICLVSKEFPTSLVEEMLNKTFGENVVKDLFKFYFKKDRPVVLTLEEIRSVLIGIVANLTKDDISHILNSKSGIAYDKIQSLGIEDNIDNSANLAKILSCLRDINLNDYSIKWDNSSQNYSYQVAGDLLFLECCKFNDYYNFKESKYPDSKVIQLKKFGYAEQISRNVVYALYNANNEFRQFRNGILFPIYDINGEIKCKEGHHIIGENAVYALGVLPALENESNDIQIAFRGTLDLQSLFRDINPLERESLTKVFTNPLTQGPGTLSYQAIQTKLLASAAEFIDIALTKLEKQSLNLELLGHSLGASDSQRFLTDICNNIGSEKIRDVGSPSSFSKIDKIDFFGFNPPAIEKKVCESFISALNEMEPKLPINIRYFVSQYDVVSSTGECFVGHGAEKLKNVGVSRFEFSHPSVDGNMFGDSANSVQGGNPSESNPIQRLADAHTNFDLSEVEFNGNREKVNPVFICGACTNIPNDKELLKENRFLPNNNLLSKKKLSDALKSDHFFTMA